MSNGEAVREMPEWAGERCVHPPWHAAGTLCLLRPDATLVGRSYDGSPRWQTERLGPPPRILSARSGAAVFGDHLLAAVEDACVWLTARGGEIAWRRAKWPHGIRQMARAKDRVFDYRVERPGGDAELVSLELSSDEEHRLFARP